MGMEQRDVGRWKRNEQTNGTKTSGSASEGYARGRNSRSMGVGGTECLDRSNVDSTGKRCEGRRVVNMAKRILYYGGGCSSWRRPKR